MHKGWTLLTSQGNVVFPGDNLIFKTGITVEVVRYHQPDTFNNDGEVVLSRITDDKTWHDHPSSIGCKFIRFA